LPEIVRDQHQGEHEKDRVAKEKLVKLIRSNMQQLETIATFCVGFILKGQNSTEKEKYFDPWMEILKDSSEFAVLTVFSDDVEKLNKLERTFIEVGTLTPPIDPNNKERAELLRKQITEDVIGRLGSRKFLMSGKAIQQLLVSDDSERLEFCPKMHCFFIKRYACMHLAQTYSYNAHYNNYN
jgi:hypothetical protein